MLMLWFHKVFNIKTMISAKKISSKIVYEIEEM